MLIKTSNQTIDTDKLTQEEKDQLRQALDTPQGRFVPKLSEEYWLVNNAGKVSCIICYSDEADAFMIRQGNCFATETEAQKHLDYLNAVAVIKADAEWWNEDIISKAKKGFYGYYNIFKEKLLVHWDETNVNNAIYFQTEEKLEQSQKEHKAEWLTYLKVEK